MCDAGRDASNKLAKTLILARHGRTVGNRDGHIVGQSDSPLTETGLEKTRLLADYTATAGIDEICCSPLGRARQTAEIYAERIGKSVVTEDAMKELSCGAWEGELRRRFVPNGIHIRSTWDERPPGGESYRDAEARVEPVVTSLKSRIETSVVLLIAHASVNRVFLKLWLDLDPDTARVIDFPNDLVYFLGTDGSCSRRTSDGITGEGLSFLR